MVIVHFVNFHDLYYQLIIIFNIKIGVDKYIISLAEEQVLVDSSLPMSHVHNLLATTGLTVIMRGQGAATEGAVVIIELVITAINCVKNLLNDAKT